MSCGRSGAFLRGEKRRPQLHNLRQAASTLVRECTPRRRLLMGAPLLQARDAASLTIALSADGLLGRTQREIARFLKIELLRQAERFVPRCVTRFDDLPSRFDDLLSRR